MDRKKVAVAMSGGVDSSLVAALLLDKGFEVVGVTMRLEDNETDSKSCCSRRELKDARSVANYLGIFHHIVDFRGIFQAEVENYFVEEYLRGRTPNPCVMCNKKIKFGRLFDFAKNIGADFLATGHYAQIVFEDGRYKLKKAVDTNKDQSYVLYNISADKLSQIKFPLGAFTKAETRKLAEEMKLPVAHKPDSQEICFVPNDDYKNFLQGRAENSTALMPGEIIDTSGKVLGRHTGVANYTIGQRKGLGIAAPQALYVLKLDTANKKVIVGRNEELFSNSLLAENVHWIYKPSLPAKLQAKVRYSPKIFNCVVEEENNFIRVKFAEPVRAITAGQSVVFYSDDELLGGGVIV